MAQVPTITLTIKKLQGAEISMEVHRDFKILTLKTIASEKLRAPVDYQTLIYLGQPLDDEMKISDYPHIVNGAKINLIMKPESQRIPPAGATGTPNFRPMRKSPQEMLKEYFMDVYDYSEEEAITCVYRAESYIADQVRNMSLQDIERWLLENHRPEPRRPDTST